MKLMDSRAFVTELLWLECYVTKSRSHIQRQRLTMTEIVFTECLLRLNLNSNRATFYWLKDLIHNDINDKRHHFI